MAWRPANVHEHERGRKLDMYQYCAYIQVQELHIALTVFVMLIMLICPCEPFLYGGRNTACSAHGPRHAELFESAFGRSHSYLPVTISSSRA